MKHVDFGTYLKAKNEVLSGVEFKEETKLTGNIITKVYSAESGDNFYEITNTETTVTEFWSTKFPLSRYYNESPKKEVYEWDKSNTEKYVTHETERRIKAIKNGKYSELKYCDLKDWQDLAVTIWEEYLDRAGVDSLKEFKEVWGERPGNKMKLNVPEHLLFAGVHGAEHFTDGNVRYAGTHDLSYFNIEDFNEFVKQVTPPRPLKVMELVVHATETENGTRYSLAEYNPWSIKKEIFEDTNEKWKTPQGAIRYAEKLGHKIIGKEYYTKNFKRAA